jgi:predicted amidohydrolase YtcJ
MMHIDQAYVNGSVVTMDDHDCIQEAVAVKADKIAAIGSNAQIKALCSPNTKVIDLQGKTLVPGFVDGHSHLMPAGVQSLYEVSLDSPPVGTTQCIADIVQALKKKAATLPKGQWVIGAGYDDTLLAEKRHLTNAELDLVSTEHPVVVVHISGHVGSVNSAALRWLGINRNTPDPEGGQIVRDPLSGEPNGYLTETAIMDVRKKLPALSLEQGVAAASHMARQYAMKGVTTVQDGIVNDLKTLEQLVEAKKSGRMPTRLVVWLAPALIRGIKCGDVKVKGLAESGLAIRTAKLFHDGSIQAWTAYLTKPYFVQLKNAAPDYRGWPVRSREELVCIVKELHKMGFQIAIHGNGDAAIDDILFAYEAAQNEFPRPDARHVVVHAQTAREDQLDKMKALSVIPSFFVVHTYYWGDRHSDIFLGSERAARISPLKSALNRGLPFTLHTDTPVTPIDPLFLAWSAVNRLSTSGRVIGTEQRISALQALRAVTINSARQAFEEHTRGSIEPGKFADFAILSGDPFASPNALKDIRVLETIVGGTTIYRSE